MCGITAIFSPHRPVEQAQLASATARIAHRGPDGQLIWVSPSGHAGLGHRRLDITTATTPQPISNEDGSIHLAVNGEFYDHQRIRADLIARGHHFRTTTDSEIALHLYEEYGSDCLNDLRGEFAFVLWDEKRQTLFAARDRFGIKPLFYAWHNQQLLFASEAKALFAAGLPANWDEQAVYERIFGCYQSDRSFFAGVEQLPPGHTLTIRVGGRIRLNRYWDINYPKIAHQHVASESDLIEMVHDHLLEAVTLRMQAHVPVGCLLSGGLDSSTALAIACANSDQPVAAFTIAFDEAAHDESAKAQRTADYLGATLHVVPAGDDDLADHFSDAAYAGEMVQYNAHGVARWLLSRAIQKEGYRAVLAGEGADELFAGYAFMQAAVATKNGGQRWLPLLSKMGRLFAGPDSAETDLFQLSPSVARASRLFPIDKPLRNAFYDGLGLLQGTLAPDFAERFASHDPYWRLLRTLNWRKQLLQREPAKQIVYLWLHTLFANYHLAADRLDMAHAVEVRLPFLDHHLFQKVGAIPTAKHVQQGHQKYLLRRVCERYLPHEIAFRPKKPFYAPPITLRPGSRIRQLTADTLHGQTMASIPFFSQQAALDLFNYSHTAPIDQQGVLDSILMMLVSLCHLQEQFRL